MGKSIPDMTFEELEWEHKKNSATKEAFKIQLENESDSTIALELSRKLLSLATRNERLVKQQLLLMKGELYEASQPQAQPKTQLPSEPEITSKSTSVKKGKLKKPIDMSIDELRAEIELNNARCEELEKQRKLPDITARIEADQELRTLSSRTRKLCQQKISLLTHEISLLQPRNS